VIGRGLVASLLAALVVATAADPAAAGGIGWRACGPRLDCARVPVPLDWARPGGPTIRLAVIRHRAGRPAARIGSLVFVPGGPGVSGVDTVRQGGALLDAMGRGRFDVVGWDVRSSAVRCFRSAAARARFWQGWPVPATPADELGHLARTEAFARRCGERGGDLLAHVTTADTARDLDRLRRLLGERRITVAARSGGTMVGQTYANMFPRRVRAMVLDGVVDPAAYSRGTEAWLAAGLADDDRVFAEFLRLCASAGPSRCALAGDLPAGGAGALLARLPGATRGGRLTVTEAVTAMKGRHLGSPSTWPQLARDLKAAVDGDGSALERTATAFATERFRRSLEPAQATACADAAAPPPRPWPRVLDRLARISPIGAPLMGWTLGAPCASWPVRGADRYTGPWDASTPDPILLVGTRLDPDTPLAGARHAERLLGNAVLLTHDGHGGAGASDPSACVEAAVTRYLVDVVAPAPGTVCPSDRLPFEP
jgi:pimeloyl-ACP methyl ester carboxylesterase